MKEQDRGIQRGKDGGSVMWFSAGETLGVLLFLLA